MLLLGRPLVDHYVHGLATSFLAYQEHGAYSAHRNCLERIATEIRNVVSEGQPIYVWAYDAGVYLHASRPAASRFIYPRSDRQMREILADLDAGKAHAILVPERSPEFDQWCDQACYEHLAEILGRYETGSTAGRYSVWVRPADRPQQTEGTAPSGKSSPDRFP